MRKNIRITSFRINETKSFCVIELEGYRSLKAGQKVNFEVVHGDKGSHATKIIPIVE